MYERGGTKATTSFLTRLARAFACVALVVSAAAPARAEIIDRILAIVGGKLITLSDVLAAQRFGLEGSAGSGETSIRATLDRLIERELQLAEVNRYMPPEPPEEVVDARIAGIRERFDSQAAFDAVLAETGLTPAQLRGRVRDNLRIETYLQQRFGVGLEPGEQDVLQYYRMHQDEFIRNGTLRPFEEVRDEARALLMRERRQVLVQEWVEGLRRRAEVMVVQ